MLKSLSAVVLSLLLVGPLMADEATMDYTGSYAGCGCDSCGDGSCGECAPAVDDCCGCWQPMWTVRAGAIFLKRDDRSDSPIFIDQSGAPIITDAVYDFDYETGFDVSVARRLDCCREFEVRYFQIDNWDDARRLTVPPGGLFNVDPPAMSPRNGNLVDTQYSSLLRSGEINLKCCYTDCIKLLAGFRWVDVNEDIAFQFLSGPAMARFRGETRNRLLGFQLGAETMLYGCGCWRVDAYGKAGVYNNDAEYTARLMNIVNNLVGTDQIDKTAFLGELGIAAAYQINCCLAVRVGYQVTLIDGVALASEQLPTTQNPPPLIGTNPLGVQVATGTVLYHGGLVQLEYKR